MTTALNLRCGSLKRMPTVWSKHRLKKSKLCWQYVRGSCQPQCNSRRLVGLVVKAFASRAENSGFDSCLRRENFSRSSHTSDLQIGTPVATLPFAWRYRVNPGTAWPGVSMLWLGEVESLICNLYLSVAARKIVWADPPLRYTSMWLRRIRKKTVTVLQCLQHHLVKTTANLGKRQHVHSDASVPPFHSLWVRAKSWGYVPMLWTQTEQRWWWAVLGDNGHVG